MAATVLALVHIYRRLLHQPIYQRFIICMIFVVPFPSAKSIAAFVKNVLLGANLRVFCRIAVISLNKTRFRVKPDYTVYLNNCNLWTFLALRGNNFEGLEWLSHDQNIWWPEPTMTSCMFQHWTIYGHVYNFYYWWEVCS
ncbi:hypothetical protein PVAP13_9NG207719 [Panicum virgatum]|uniref:Uncharacterized protein n=1 Tax=Panicum virgatum TaxID=38727 RepID=A0A8T0MN82_PANVG|nr:hypothetical protein PVAP13_9NG207719 [Panicum virgatum]